MKARHNQPNTVSGRACTAIKGVLVPGTSASAPVGPRLLWRTEAMVTGGRQILGCGWIFHPEQVLTSLHLCFFSCSGEETPRIPIAHGLRREDVGRIYPRYPNSRNSGFAFSATLGLDLSRYSPVLEARLASGDVEHLEIPFQNLLVTPSEGDRKHGRGRTGLLFVLSKRALRLIGSGQFSPLWEKLARYSTKRPRRSLKNISKLWALVAGSRPGDVSLIVDHDLGGGATDYRNKLSNILIEQGRTVFLFSYHLTTLKSTLLVRSQHMEERYSIPDSDFLLAAADRLNLGEIIYNTGVSLPEGERLPMLLLQLKARTGARLRIFVHDYFVICPSHFLLNVEGQFCHVPDPKVCASCLPDNKHPLTRPQIVGDILLWRSLWGALLAGADEILTFSASSRRYLLKAYPNLGLEHVAVLPHEVVRYRDIRIHLKDTGKLSIGVVGYIGYHKGAAVVQALAREIKSRLLDIPVTIFGTIDVRCEPDVVRVTGPYAPSQLPGLIESSGVNVMLFPSICAETFSYVVQELINLRLPIAAFNLGAPAERLLTYDKSLVLESTDPITLLQNLIAFHRKIYRDGTES